MLMLLNLSEDSERLIFTLLTTSTPTVDSSRVHQDLMQFTDRSTDLKYKLLRYCASRDMDSE